MVVAVRLPREKCLQLLFAAVQYIVQDDAGRRSLFGPSLWSIACSWPRTVKKKVFNGHDSRSNLQGPMARVGTELTGRRTRQERQEGFTMLAHLVSLGIPIRQHAIVSEWANSFRAFAMALVVVAARQNKR